MNPDITYVQTAGRNEKLKRRPQDDDNASQPIIKPNEMTELMNMLNQIMQ